MACSMNFYELFLRLHLPGLNLVIVQVTLFGQHLSSVESYSLSVHDFSFGCKMGNKLRLTLMNYIHAPTILLEAVLSICEI